MNYTGLFKKFYGYIDHELAISYLDLLKQAGAGDFNGKAYTIVQDKKGCPLV